MKRVTVVAAAAAAVAMQASTVVAQVAAAWPTNSDDGPRPRAAVMLSGNTLYGTTADHAGAYWGPSGTVFQVDTDGRNFAVLHYFTPVNNPASTNSDGAFPAGGLVLSGSTFYGTAQQGGAGASGTLFKMNTDGTGFAVLHSFSAEVFPPRPASYDGAHPMARLVISSNTLYGTAKRGGDNGGTVFKVNTDGTGFTTLHAFRALSGRDLTKWDGAFPETELLVSGDTLYGTARSGGPANRGTVFKLYTDGIGFTVLHSFTGSRSDPYNNHGSPCNPDGAYPEAGLVLSGTTLYGSAHAGGPAGNGTIFKLNTDGTGFTSHPTHPAAGTG